MPRSPRTRRLVPSTCCCTVHLAAIRHHNLRAGSAAAVRPINTVPIDIAFLPQQAAEMIGRLKSIANKLGYHVMSRATAEEIVESHPWLAGHFAAGAPEVPPAVPAAPRSESPRLVELRRRYAGHPATAHTVWATENVARDLDIDHF